MMQTSFISAALLIVALSLAAAPKETLSPFESDGVLTADNPIDKLVLARLEKLGVRPARVCSDAAFVRRVYLDAVGTLPTAREAKEFLLDPNPDKRRILIDRLLETEEYADYWAMRWSDLLRVKAEFPINLWPNAVQGYHHWIRASLKQNKPYDRFVRELLTASGSSFRAPEVNFYRAVQNKDPQGVAQAVALTFMGTRTEKWPKEQLSGMAAFFSRIGRKHTAEWKEEIILFDLEKAAEGDLAGVFPDGTAVKIPADMDPRDVFADWLIAPKNPWFARNIVNRQWSWLLGRGIIHEPDDIRPDNPASNPELLAYLEQELVTAKYDLKQVFRLILNSRTYQLASVPRSDTAEAKANFAYYPLRRLEAEVLIDALCQITGTTEKYSSPIPEPFTFIPESQRTIALADGSISSSFLEMFGRPPRDNGLEAERNNRTSPAQRLHFLNSSHIQRKIEQGRKLQTVIQSGSNLRETATEIYLTIVSRQPTEEELKTLETYAGTGVAKGREVLVDLAWSLFNSSEFLYRH